MSVIFLLNMKRRPFVAFCDAETRLWPFSFPSYVEITTINRLDKDQNTNRCSADGHSRVEKHIWELRLRGRFCNVWKRSLGSPCVSRRSAHLHGFWACTWATDSVQVCWTQRCGLRRVGCGQQDHVYGLEYNSGGCGHKNRPRFLNYVPSKCSYTAWCWLGCSHSGFSEIKLKTSLFSFSFHAVLNLVLSSSHCQVSYRLDSCIILQISIYSCMSRFQINILQGSLCFLMCYKNKGEGN